MSTSKLRGLFEYNMYRLSQNDIQKCLKRMQQEFAWWKTLVVVPGCTWNKGMGRSSSRCQIVLDKLIWLGWLLVTWDPETNSKFASESCWLKYDSFLLGPGLFSAVSFTFQSTWVSLAFSSHHFGGPPGLRLVAWRTFKSQCRPVENDLPRSTVWMDGQTAWSSKGPQMVLLAVGPTISMELLQSKHVFIKLDTTKLPRKDSCGVENSWRVRNSTI